MRVLVLLACLAAAVCAEKARFDNYEVHRVIPDNKYQLKVLQELQEYPDELSFWGDVRGVGRAVDIMVPPHKKAAFEKLLRDFHMPHSLFIDNVQQYKDAANTLTRNFELIFCPGIFVYLLYWMSAHSERSLTMIDYFYEVSV